MRILWVILIVMAGSQITGCKTKVSEALQPAVVTDAMASRDGIRQGLRQLFSGMDLMIASDAFVEQSQITLERKARSSLEGNLTAGVVDEPPLKVELLTDGQSCYL